MELKKLAEQLGSMLEKKNRAYGDSYFKTRRRYGEIAFLIRLEDKINRLEQLINGVEDNGENIIDTLFDIAGYCLLEICYRQNKKEGERDESNSDRSGLK